MAEHSERITITDALAWDCAEGECEHSDEDDQGMWDNCPRITIEVCVGCMDEREFGDNVIEDLTGLDRLTPGEWVIDADGDALCLVDTHLGWHQRMWMPKAKKGRVGLVVSLEHARFPVALAEIDPEYVCKHDRGTNECGHCYLCGVVVSDAKPRYFDAATLEVVRDVGRANAQADSGRATNPTVAEHFLDAAQHLRLDPRTRREAMDQLQTTADYLARKPIGTGGDYERDGHP